MRDHFVILINGHLCRVGYAESLMTLAEFLRHRGLVGTKVVCNEGDCGACSVLVGRVSQDESRLEYQTVDSCILFLFQLDRASVVTVEGLRDGNGLTPIQQAMVDCHGSQCGFCTPGFVVTLHGTLESNQDFDNESVRYALSGNLCRCTGYQQILNAAESVEIAKVRRMDDLYPPETIIERLREFDAGPVRVEGNHVVFLPQTLEQATAFKAEYPAATVISGATDIGVLHNHDRLAPSDLLCLSAVEDFDHVSIDDDEVRIGGGATWTQIENAVRDEFPPYHEIITRFGSPQIRNCGTLAGNLATGSPIGDSIPFHLVMDSRLRLVSATGQRSVPLNEFYTGYRQNVMHDDELIGEIITPRLQPNDRLVLYKISKRRDMDISTLTFGLWIQLDGDVITQARFALGGIGPTVQRMRDSEQFLIGKTVSESTFHEAGVIAREQITPWSDVRGSADFRLQLTENLMRKAFGSCQLSVVGSQ